MESVKNTKIYAAWPGTGKTHACEISGSKAVEIEYWKYKDHLPDKHYIADIKNQIGKVDYIFLSTDPAGLQLLHKEGLEIILVYPQKELREEYLDRYIKRNDSPDFIGAFMKYWHLWLEELEKQKYCQRIVLEKGKYLQDVLNKNLNTTP